MTAETTPYKIENADQRIRVWQVHCHPQHRRQADLAKPVNARTEALVLFLCEIEKPSLAE